jgi:hypothetical protein
MSKIKEQYKGVSVEYLIGKVRVTKKIEELTESDILTAKKWGVNLAKYFHEEEKTEITVTIIDEICDKPQEEERHTTIAYEGVVEAKPKRKRK